MQHYELKLKVPYGVLINLHKSLDEVGDDLKKQAAIRYYKKRKLSLGKAAELAGMSRLEFIDYLKFNSEPIFQYSEQELNEIIADAEKLRKLIDE